MIHAVRLLLCLPVTLQTALGVSFPILGWSSIWLKYLSRSNLNLYWSFFFFYAFWKTIENSRSINLVALFSQGLNCLPFFWLEARNWTLSAQSFVLWCFVDTTVWHKAFQNFPNIYNSVSFHSPLLRIHSQKISVLYNNPCHRVLSSRKWPHIAWYMLGCQPLADTRALWVPQIHKSSNQ